MAWIYLAASEDSASPLENGLDQLPIAKSIPTVKVCCFHEWPQEIYGRRLYGMTLPPWMDQNSNQKLMLSTQDFHVRISALQEIERVWQESEADYFSRSYGWPKKSNQNSFFLKTQKEFCPKEELKLLKRLPPSGIHQDGLLKAVKRLDLPKIVKDGFVWPTPNTLDYLPPRPWKALKKQFETTRKGRKKPANLREAIHKECYPSIQPYDHKTIGTLNPLFVEWIQGYPLQWTELGHWEIQWFQFKRKKRLKN